jgi:hypothetical protein
LCSYYGVIKIDPESLYYIPEVRLYVYRGCDKLEKARWKMSQRDIRNASKSPKHSRQKRSRAAGASSKHVAKKVSPRKAM